MSEDDSSKRGNINELIQQLLTVIPDDFFQEYKKNEAKLKEELASSGKFGSSMPLGKGKGSGVHDGKPTKGQILTQAVEYVNSLQERVDLKNREEVELILKVKELSKQTGSIVNDLNLDNTSAEIALARIGVGPLAGMFDEENKADQVLSSSASKEGPRYHFEYGGYSEYNNGT